MFAIFSVNQHRISNCSTIPRETVTEDRQTDTQTLPSTEQTSDKLSTDPAGSNFNSQPCQTVPDEKQDIPPAPSASSDESKYYSLLEVEEAPSGEAQNDGTPSSRESSGGSGSSKSSSSQNKAEFQDAMQKTMEIRKKIESKRSWKTPPDTENTSASRPLAPYPVIPPKIPERSARDKLGHYRGPGAGYKDTRQADRRGNDHYNGDRRDDRREDKRDDVRNDIRDDRRGGSRDNRYNDRRGDYDTHRRDYEYDDTRRRQAEYYTDRPSRAHDDRPSRAHDDRPYSSYYNSVQRHSDSFRDRRSVPPPPIPERYDSGSCRNSRQFSSVRDRNPRPLARSRRHQRTRSEGGEGPRDQRYRRDPSPDYQARNRSAPPKSRGRNQLDESRYAPDPGRPPLTSTIPRPGSVRSRSHSRPRVSFANDRDMARHPGYRSLESDLNKVNLNQDFDNRSKTLPRRLPSQNSGQSGRSDRGRGDRFSHPGYQTSERNEPVNRGESKPPNYGDYLANSYRGSVRFKRKLNYSSRSFKNFTFYNL